MIRLSIPSEPYWLDIIKGVRVRVRPLTSAIYEAAKAHGAATAADMRAYVEDNPGAAAPLDLNNEYLNNGVIGMLVAEGLAKFGILSWEGIGLDDGTVAAVTEKSVLAFARHPKLGQAFVLAYIAPLVALDIEGNALGSAPNGTSAAGPNIAKGVPKTGSRARKVRKSKPKKVNARARTKKARRKVSKAPPRGD